MIKVTFSYPMELFMAAGSSQGVPHYNCSIIPRIPQGVEKEVMAYFFFAYGIIAECFYALALSTMVKLIKNRRIYAIMFALGIYDVIALAVSALLTGYLFLIGAEYCTHPDLIYVTGSIGLATWAGSCLTFLILIWNRILDLWNSRLAEKIFGKNRIYIWVILPIIYTLYFFFFTPPILFDSRKNTWILSPMIYGTAEESSMFHNHAHTINNILVVLLICLSYIVLAIGIRLKFGNSQAVTQFQRSIILQATVICTVNLVAALIAVHINYFPSPWWLPLVVQIAWTLGHGIPALVYLTMNQTIRRELKKRAAELKILCKSSISPINRSIMSVAIR